VTRRLRVGAPGEHIARMAENHDELLRTAERVASDGNYKDAYNLLAKGPWRGGREDQIFRHRRGVYAYNVAHERLNQFERTHRSKTTLIKAGCWLARANAYLESAAEDAPEPERQDIASVIGRTREEADRFRELCREFGVDLFVNPGDEDVSYD
jgi:hypothetical protein